MLIFKDQLMQHIGSDLIMFIYLNFAKVITSDADNFHSLKKRIVRF